MNVTFLSDLRRKMTQFLKNLVLKERSPEKLTMSFAIGVYIAICPFVGLHTAMIFVFAWFFRLNTAVTFATGYVVNNVFTAIPIFLGDYAFGYWLLHKVLHLKTEAINPAWATGINEFLYAKLGIPHACFWSFMVGGNIVAIVLAVVSYPLIKPVFKRLVAEIYKRKQAKL